MARAATSRDYRVFDGGVVAGFPRVSLFYYSAATIRRTRVKVHGWSQAAADTWAGFSIAAAPVRRQVPLAPIALLRGIVRGGRPP